MRADLDTSILEWCGTHHPEQVVNRKKAEAHRKRAERIWGITRMVLAIPAGIFIWRHWGVFVQCPMQLLEAAGVLAGAACIASGVADVLR